MISVKKEQKTSEMVNVALKVKCEKCLTLKTEKYDKWNNGTTKNSQTEKWWRREKIQ